MTMRADFGRTWKQVSMANYKLLFQYFFRRDWEKPWITNEEAGLWAMGCHKITTNLLNVAHKPWQPGSSQIPSYSSYSVVPDSSLFIMYCHLAIAWRHIHFNSRHRTMTRPKTNSVGPVGHNVFASPRSPHIIYSQSPYNASSDTTCSKKLIQHSEITKKDTTVYRLWPFGSSKIPAYYYLFTTFLQHLICFYLISAIGSKENLKPTVFANWARLLSSSNIPLDSDVTTILSYHQMLHKPKVERVVK
jgi:hypothetical protein